MPAQTQDALNWALMQTVEYFGEVISVTKDTPSELVDHVRQYFNTQGIQYGTFSYDDLVPYL